MNSPLKTLLCGLVLIHGLAVSATLAAETIEVPAGSFEMGEAGVAEPVHTVTLTHSFFMDRYEVTNAEYAYALQWALGQGTISVSEATGIVTDMASGRELIYLNEGGGQNQCWIDYGAGSFSVVSGYEQWPVAYMSWHGAAAYCDWRSGMEGRTPAYLHAFSNDWPCGPGGNPYLADGYRLPTEAEWEYAAQYDDERVYPWGNTAPAPGLANYGSNVDHPEPVGSHPSGDSFLSLSDLAGNVEEWVNDWYGAYGSGPETDPTGQAGGSYRIQRGGAYWQADTYLRCSDRSDYGTPQSGSGLGFRTVRTSDLVSVEIRTWGRIKAGYR
jgi:formylglycine-generating enzyme required for sulfatase activity